MNEIKLAQMVAEHESIGMILDAIIAFHFYASCTFYDPTYRNTQFNYALLLVGYGPYYWIEKNNWKSMWGINGYIYIATTRGNICGNDQFTYYRIV